MDEELVKYWFEIRLEDFPEVEFQHEQADIFDSTPIAYANIHIQQ